MARFSELSIAAATAYAELAEQTRTFELSNALAGLVGSFQKLTRKGRAYWYFAYRDLDSKVRMVYVGPDDQRVQALVERFDVTRGTRPLAPQAQAALALGCAAATPKHFRIIKRLAEYGFFRAGGILIGTHAFLALGNVLGVRWTEGASTLDTDFAHAGRNVSLALPADLRIDVHGALESLEMGLLPASQFDGKAGPHYRNPSDQELRIDFVTSATRRRGPLVMPELNLVLQPLKFMELSLESPSQACIVGRAGSCMINLPAPERYALHKLIVSGERPVAEKTKAKKDLLQAASLASYFLETGQSEIFNLAWRDAVRRGKGWRARLLHGKSALLRLAPDVDAAELWKI
ncbi:MAG: GSU2403 family nucleotidyltransferase fold protein [Polyangia bacterium]